MPKLKRRNIADFVRRQNTRDQCRVVLIVCEGEETEPNYLIKRATCAL